jgi:hypothetical protein
MGHIECLRRAAPARQRLSQLLHQRLLAEKIPNGSFTVAGLSASRKLTETFEVFGERLRNPAVTDGNGRQLP